MLTEAEARRLGFEIAQRVGHDVTGAMADRWFIRRIEIPDPKPQSTGLKSGYPSKSEALAALENEIRWREWFLGL